MPTLQRQMLDLRDKGFKAAIIKILQRTINMFKTHPKKKKSLREIKSQEGKNGNFINEI